MEVTILAIIVVVILLIHFSRNKRKGRYGEKRVATILNSLPDEYTIFNDVYIEENGKSTQIDHVVFSPYGIFVIETKQYKGWIYGDERASFWTKNIYGNKYEFYNPLLQKYGHVKALESLLGFPYQYFIPIVVFIGDVTIKGDYPNHNVVYENELLDTIKYHISVLLPDDKLKWAINRLAYSSFETSDTAKEHIIQVKNRISQYNSIINNGICPRCGGKLVLRQGRYRNFWGCSNYPHCHYIVKDY